MKKLIKPILLTLIILGAATAGLYFYLTKKSDPANEFDARRVTDQSDQEDSRAYRYDTDRLAVELKTEGKDKNVLNFDKMTSFSMDKTDEARDRLKRLIKRTDAEFDKPIIAANPFGTVPNSYYFYFVTEFKCMVKYTITVEKEDIKDFTRYVANGNPGNTTNEHEFCVDGLIPGMTNYIIMELVDETGSHREDITYKADVPAVGINTKLNVTEGRSDEKLENGLFYVFPKGDKRIYGFDNSGNMRNVIATESGHGKRIYQSSNRLLYQISPTKIVRTSALGEINGLVSISGCDEVLDFSYDGYENVYALVRKGKKHKIVSASFDTKRMKTVFGFDKKVKPTSITSPAGGNAYVSTEKPCGILRIKALTSTRPRVELVLGAKKDWKKTKYKKKLIKNKEIKDWKFIKSVISIDEDESSGEQDVIMAHVLEKGKDSALRFMLKAKDKSVEVIKSTPIVEGSDVLFEKYGKHNLLTNLKKGSFAEYDEHGDVTKEFSGGGEIDALWKLSLGGICFYE